MYILQRPEAGIFQSLYHLDSYFFSFSKMTPEGSKLCRLLVTEYDACRRYATMRATLDVQTLLYHLEDQNDTVAIRIICPVMQCHQLEEVRRTSI
jgi:hypothetical protein